MSEVRYEGVAIIGMSGRFPGAETIEEFWANLVAGNESISFFSDEELKEGGLDPAFLRQRGQYVPARGVLKDADCFDAPFFGMHPREAEVTDPQQRVFLEACWSALEQAGYDPHNVGGSVGLFAGITYNTYFPQVLLHRPDLLELVGADMVMFGNEKDYLTTRVAYKLGLKGPALNISTACSTSLVAVCQACQSLLTYQCDTALAGGASVRVPQKSGYFYDEGNIGSPDGHTRTFDARAAGTTFSNGVGVVVLKRLEDAVNDGDQIYAVIKGAALNNDGSQRVSFGAPGVEGQSEVIAMAHALAGVDPETITYVEAHGTATPLGDPIELAGLTKAFRMGTEAKQFCGIGSVKSNVGHLDAASGVTGLIKTTLGLHRKTIPASLHFIKPNPKLEIENSPFYVVSSTQEWKGKAGSPRRAGVSSFGSGGTNAHVVLEEAPELAASSSSRSWQLLAVSAKTSAALDRATANLAGHLKSLTGNLENSDAPSRGLADAAFTLQTGRSQFAHRRVVVCQDASEGAGLLEALDTKRVFTQQEQLREPPVVFMFPGQGAQYPGMGSELYRSEPVFRDEVDRCAAILQPILKSDIRSVLFPAIGSEKEAEQILLQTRFTQPALFVIEYALAKLWMSWGIKPAAMIGHSVGEYVAACLAGVFTVEDGLVLVARRGALVQAQPSGAMLAVRLPEKEILPLLNARTEIAAINSNSLSVVAGPHEAIEELEKNLKAQGITTRHLHTSHAFHSQMMEPVVAPFTEMVRQVKLSVPQIPYVSNVTAKWITETEAKTPKYWADHVRQTVRFADGVAELMQNSRNVLLEIGPGQTLTTLTRQHPAKKAEQNVFSSLALTGAQEPRGMLETLGRLWMAGVNVDWQGFYARESRRRIALPTYPFERARFWPERIPAPAQQAAAPIAASSASTIGSNNGRESGPHMTASLELEAFNGAPVAAPAAVASADSAPSLPRKDRLLAASRSLLEEVSGYNLAEVDPAESLLELGLDSLLLTQAAQLFHRKFGVAFTFRQLMEELSSLDAIASYLDETLAPSAFAPPAPVAPAPAPIAATAGPVQNFVPTAVAPSAPLTASSTLEQILLQQQQLTSQILQMMIQQQRGAAPVVPAAAPASTIPAPTAQVSKTATAAKPPSGKSHGPFKPFDKNAHTSVTPEQQEYLQKFITRYIQRTSASKKLAEQNRSTLADPRSAAGFNRLWKEMVYPFYTTKSDGSRVWDVDGNEYIDFVMGFGSSLFGHRPPFVVKAVHEQLDLGFEIGPIQPIAGEVAALIKEFTGMPRVAFTNTGSEAVLAATRLARTVSGRDKIAVFAGAYHGIFDEVLFRPLTVNGETRTAAIAPGIPESALGQVIVLDYGNPESLEILRARGSEIAAVLVEPVQSRRLDLQPKQFMHELRKVTKETGSALIFDEVVTGFRVHPGGAQALFGIRADLAVYGKVVGGGLPIGVVTGDPKYMDALDGGQWQYGDTSFPEVGVTFFAGTFMRHPLVIAAAKAVLTHLKEAGSQLQSRLTERTEKLARQLREVVEEFRAPYVVTQFSSLLQIGYPSDQKFAGLLFYLLRERGIHIWENRAFVMTTAHSDKDTEQLVRVFRESLAELRSGGFLPPPSGSGQSTLEPEGSTSTVGVSERQGVLVAERSDLGEKFPLTAAQKEIWLAAKMGGAAALGYNESLSLHFRGPFDVELFRAAAQKVVGRHPILLANFSPDGEWQQIQQGAKLKLPLIDLSGLNDADRKSKLDAAIEKEVSETFDLVKGPLLRIRIIRLSDQEYHVIWTAHHIVCDGWSGGLLISEVAKVYSAAKQGVEPTLDTPIAYREYELATRADTPEAAAAMTYWREQFADIPSPLDLTTDRPRPAIRSGEASTLKRTFDPTLQQALKRVAAQNRTTLVVLLMAALDTVLHRLTGQTDLVIGLPVAGQALTGSHCLVGHCVNLLPIRAQIQPDSGFNENLGMLKKKVLDAYDRYQCSVGGILQNLRIPRIAGRSPLVEIMFNVDRDVAGSEFPGLEFTAERNPKRALHFDMFLNFVEGPHSFLVECDYNTALFDDSTIERWLQYYQTVLESIVANSKEMLGRLSILGETDRAELLVERNKTLAALPAELLYKRFEDWAAKAPDSCSVVFDGESLTYRELNRRANQLANHLKNHGLEPNALVGLYVERSLEMLVGLLGILKAGAAYIPLDPSFPKDRLTYMVEDSEMRVLVTHRGLQKSLSVCPPQVVQMDSEWEIIAKNSGENVKSQDVTPSQLAYVLYTSGSTGKPKGVEIPHSAVVNFLLSMQREPGFTEKDTLLAVTTLSFDIAGLELYLPLISGGKVVIASREDAYDPKRLMRQMNNSRCTVMQATPATWRALISAGWTGSKGLKILCGGEAFPRDLAEQLLSRCAELWNMYGPTETTIWSTVHKVTTANGPVPIGHPIVNTQVVILDSFGDLAPPGAVGELYIGGAGLARGYLGRDELTRERFVENSAFRGGRLYRTGDFARWLPDKTLECLGRVDNQVKIRGFRIELGEVEAMLSRHQAVKQCVAIVREDTPGDRVLAAYFEPTTDIQPSVADFRAHLKTELPDYMVPSLFIPMAKLPLTPNGKIDRKALPAPAGLRIEAKNDFIAPRTPLEQALARSWAKVLKIPRVGLRENFFELGGHSLAAVSLLSDIEKLTGKTLPLATLFQASTIEALAAILGNEDWKPSWSSLVPIEPQGSKDPLFLVHGAEGNVLLYRQLAKYLGPDQPVYGLQSQGLGGDGKLNTTIPSMATQYIKQMMTVQAHGPYFIGGYCLGGLISFEIAQQLTAMGEKVELVVMLDTYNQASVSPSKLRVQLPFHILQNAWFHGANAIRAKDRKKFLSEKLDIALYRSGIRLRAGFHSLRRMAGLEAPNAYPHLIVKKVNDDAADRYIPSTYNGRVAVIRSQGSFLGLGSPTLGWNEVVRGRLEVYQLPVYPKGMLIEPFCLSLGETLRLCLRNA
jgi:amino acid adenylation domain-containing protein